MPRFAILEHDHPFLHWDLMLEVEETLRTWRLFEKPAPGRTVTAEAIGDHRKAYLDYEGPVRGNRGQVKRWDGGTFAWQEDKAGRVVVQLLGAYCRGTAVIEPQSDGTWKLTLGG